MKPLLLALLLMLPVVIGGYIIYSETAECNLITREGCENLPPACDDGDIFSEKDCTCVPDPSGCSGLDEESCGKNPDCFSFQRGGTCACPSCEIYLSHQCLPK
ncbi:MAG: hypothetical protein JW727_04700 [Candidatus Aenigmarchaeota archaeon]|nr:hypothetical protein [Candidatus Aenigmarchaeota archaeon]